MSTKRYATHQEEFWAGEHGDAYIQRNRGTLPSELLLFGKVLARTRGVGSVLELGANIGGNQLALRQLLPQARLSALEINPTAVEALRVLGFLEEVIEGSILDFEPQRTYDLTFTKGVLIHIAPDMLPRAYEALYRASSRYIMISEHYSRTPQEVPYRGVPGTLHKRDFAGELLDAHPDLELVDYGFLWTRDPNFRQDDMTWFLLEKRG